MYTKTQKDIPELQNYHWPPVNKKLNLCREESLFFSMDINSQKNLLKKLRTSMDRHGEFLNETLATIYAYIFGYENSLCYLETNDELEAKLYQAKFVLEDELLNYWLAFDDKPLGLNQEKFSSYLYKLSKDNVAVDHDLFKYLESDASQENMLEFLLNETIRNEVVDDEVALLAVGLQGMLKNVAVANLYDECGKNNLIWFHTYWLRMFLFKTHNHEYILEYRKKQPWFAKITSNVFNMFLTRPSYKYRAYGCFTIFEGFVAPHFVKILNGLKRTNLNSHEINIYFKSHLQIDPNHTMELAQGIKHQVPKLASKKLDEIAIGACAAIDAANKQYHYMLAYFSDR